MRCHVDYQHIKIVINNKRWIGIKQFLFPTKEILELTATFSPQQKLLAMMPRIQEWTIHLAANNKQPALSNSTGVV